MNHEIIYKVYPQVVSIDDAEGAFDSDGNQVVIDNELISQKEAELAPEKELNFLRQKRNQLLTETDWWASSDLTMTQEQIDYRQALRDITLTYSSLEDAVFPTKPTEGA